MNLQQKHILKETLVNPFYDPEWDYLESPYETYAYLVYNLHPMATVKNDVLTLQGHEVIGYDKSFEHHIPALYCVRNENARFVCGLDLISNGKVWEGETSTQHDSIESALKSIRENDKDNNQKYFIHLEEKMRI
jgi:hypothetical protein